MQSGWKNRIWFWAGPVVGLLFPVFVQLDPVHPAISAMAGITMWMAVWWLSEVVHLAVTSLIPLIFLPLLGIADAKTVAWQYMDQVIFLFIGGFLLAFSIEKWGLHQRIALFILSRLGKSVNWVLFGVMGTAWLLSMWISNTATVMMLLSAVSAIILQVELHVEPGQHKRTARAFLLGLAYAATIGGMATLVGTPPNMVFYKEYQEAFPERHDMDFASWFAIGFPVSLVFLCFAFFLLQKLFLGKNGSTRFDRKSFYSGLKALGRMTRDQKVVLLVFFVTVLLWFTREPLVLGRLHLPGWSGFFPGGRFVLDSTVAVAMAFLLFFIPSKGQKGQNLLSWEEINRLPLDIIFLFGSGFALAKGFELSGLSAWLAGRLAGMQDGGILLLILGICVVVTIISEFASNVASIQLALPVLISMQQVLQVHPLLLMVPATLAASLGFMLPVATAPNTIVFGTGHLRVKDMMKAGLWLDIAGILLITGFVYVLVR